MNNQEDGRIVAQRVAELFALQPPARDGAVCVDTIDRDRNTCIKPSSRRLELNTCSKSIAITD